MRNDSLKTVEKLFKLHAVDGIYPSKCSTLKNQSTFYSDIENNTAIMKGISVTWDCNALSVTEIFC